MSGAGKMDVEEAGVDPYDFLSKASICTPQYHAKARKNCATNPFCVYGFGDARKQGIYKNPSVLMAELGADPSESRRQGLTKKSTTLRPVGLQNLGATCYLNVLIQSLFQNVLIRDAVLNFVPSSTIESRKTVMDDVMEALQGAFSHLILSKKNIYSLSHFTSLLGLDAGEQQDPQEFNKLFMGKLEGSKIKVLQEGRHSIAQLLEGKEAYSTVCSECKTESRRTQAFRELELKIDGLKSIDQALELYFASEDLTGENMYFCSKCDCKRNAVRRVEIEEPPPVLTIDLMRYVYDLKTFSKVKLKTSLRFEEKITLQGEEYRLVSVLYHKGRSAYGGHYVAETLDWATEQWWHCDDKSVLPCASPVKDLPPVKEAVVEVMDISESPPPKKGKAKAKGKAAARSSSTAKGKRGAANKRKRKGDDEEAEEKEGEEENDGADNAMDEEEDGETDEQGADADADADTDAEAEADAEAEEEAPEAHTWSPKSPSKGGGRKTTAKGKGKPKAKSPSKKTAKKKDGIDCDRSKDAYCFSYVKESVFQAAMSTERIAPSEGATQLVALHDEAFEHEVAEYKQRLKSIEAQVKERKETYKRVEQCLAVKSPEDEFHLVPAAWLQQWVTGVKAKTPPAVTPAASSSGGGSSSNDNGAVANGAGDGKIITPIVIDLEEEALPMGEDKGNGKGKGDGKVVTIDDDDDKDGNAGHESAVKEEEAEPAEAVDLTAAPDAAPAVFADPVENAPFRCPHSSADGKGQCLPSIPALKSQLKAISAQAYREIVAECDVDFASSNYRCAQCFEESSTKAQGLQELGQSYAGIIELLEADAATSHISQKEDGTTVDKYEVPMMWVSSLRREQSALMSGKRGAVDNTVTGVLLCKHQLKQPDTRKKTQRISPATWQAIVEGFPEAIPLLVDAPVCAQCRLETTAFEGGQHKVKAIRSREMDKIKELKPLTLVSAPRYPEVLDDKAALLAPLSDSELKNSTFYAVDDRWMNTWRAFHASKTLPTLSQRAGPLSNLSLRCEHGLCLLSDKLRNIAEGCTPGEALVVGPMGDGLPQPELVTETQWNALNEFYGPDADDGEEDEGGEDEEEFDEEEEKKKKKEREGDMEVEQVRVPPFSVSVRANAEGQFVWSPAPCMECTERLKEKHVQENTEYQDRALTISVLGVGESVPNRPAEPEGSPDKEGAEGGKGKGEGSESPSSGPTERRSKRRRKGQTFMITASSSDSLILIMLKISEKLVSNHEGKQTLYLRGKELVDKDKTMLEHGVRSGDVLHVQVEGEKESGYDLGVADSYGHSRVESGFRGSFLSMDNGVKQDDPGLVELRKLCQDMGLSLKDHLITGAFTNAKGNLEVALSILTS